MQGQLEGLPGAQLLTAPLQQMAERESYPTMTYTEAIEILKKVKRTWQFPPKWVRATQAPIC